MEGQLLRSVHQFQIKNLSGHTVSMADYAGKALLIVNTASRCGFTPQLEGLQKLYELYKGRGLEVLAFPSNDFGQQEPLEGAGIENFCTTNFRTNFPIFDKVRVKGPSADPLFQFLADKRQNGVFNAPARWNFQKYLINRKGECVTWYYPFTSPMSGRVKKAVEKLL